MSPACCWWSLQLIWSDSRALAGLTQKMDVLSSSTWKETIGGEIKAKKAWKAKYGHQFELEDSCAPSVAGSRPATGMSRPATGASRAPSQMSNRSQGPEQRQKLLDLKAKLSAALAEVEGELQETQRLK